MSTYDIEAKKGIIGGWNLNEHSLFVEHNNNRIYFGDGTEGEKDVFVVRTGTAGNYSYPFYVRADGTMSAEKANIIGKITATSGAIGGWEIGETTLTNGGRIIDAAMVS